MSLAAKLESAVVASPSDPAARTVGTRKMSAVVRDLALLLAACLTVGLAVGIGMMLAVLVLA